MTAHKVLIIGLDGADWRVLQPQIDAGKLPNLAKLQSEGSYGRLHSTIRPESSVAWSTFATGVNPGKHGVFGFVHHQPGTYNFTLADSRSVAVPCFWDYLSAAGKRVSLVNIPFTYPPKKVNGFLIGGMLTPGAHVPFVYPSTLQEKLLKQFRPFLFDAGDGGQEKTAVAQRVFAYTEQQLQIAKMLLAEADWDCFTVVFTGLDRLQHFLWNTPQHRQHLQQLDIAIGGLIDGLPAETIVLLVSDHGFEAVGSRFYINHWLQEEGYLSLKQNQPTITTMTKVMETLKRIPLIRRLKRLFLPANWGPAKLKTTAFGQAINWKQTRAYYAPDGGIRINLSNREPQGIVSMEDHKMLCQELTDKLLALRDPRLDSAPIARVERPEMLYSGKFAINAPDLIVEPQREATQPEHNYIIDGQLEGGSSCFGAAHPYNGNHATTGIFVAWRPGIIDQQEAEDANIQDIAPTVLATLDTPVASYMDGRVLQTLFTQEHQLEPVIDTEQTLLISVEVDEMAEDDAVLVEERLRNLGYLE